MLVKGLLGRNDIAVAKVRLGVPHEAVCILLPTKHVKALAQLKKEYGETRSEVIRHVVALYLYDRAKHSPAMREILGDQL